ncbi:MAG TPA: PIN domain-containing protein [Gaiellaceae bacterium]|nr:PIN domain-containing protein [Gaiellaceae bacterium]
MIAVDTSVAVAAALPWHGSHQASRAALPERRAPLLAQVAVETYSVLTRLPPPQRVPALVALDYLKATFAFPPLALSPDGFRELLEVVAAQGIVGGAVYDALVAASARQVGATLVTLDQRALATYRLLGADYRLLT